MTYMKGDDFLKGLREKEGYDHRHVEPAWETRTRDGVTYVMPTLPEPQLSPWRIRGSLVAAIVLAASALVAVAGFYGLARLVLGRIG